MSAATMAAATPTHPWAAKARTPLPTVVYAPPPPRRRIYVIAGVVLAALLALVLLIPVSYDSRVTTIGAKFNTTYPATPPQQLPDGSISYRIGVIADLDKDSRDQKEMKWHSHFYRGVLVRQPDGKYRISLNEPVTLTSALSEAGRGLELSELQYFNGKLYSIDDRTGVVYEIMGSQVIPRFVLTDGAGDVSKGFKGEWMAVKGHRLVVGGMGKEWTTPTGEVVNTHPQWVKAISPAGQITHYDWVPRYNAMLEAAGISRPGYMIHESGAWSDIHKQWFFLPRKVSAQKYDDVEDERRGSNILIRASENFETVKVQKVGSLVPTHGYSSFKFIPKTGDRHILALKSEEVDGKTHTYATVISLDGAVLMPETRISDDKLEGVEFL